MKIVLQFNIKFTHSIQRDPHSIQREYRVITNKQVSEGTLVIVATKLGIGRSFSKEMVQK